MKFLFALSALLAAATTTTVRADGIVEVCSAEHQLLLGDQVIGHYKVTEISEEWMTVEAAITVDGVGNGAGDLTYPYIKSVMAQACCLDTAGDVIPTKCSPEITRQDNHDPTDQHLTFDIMEPKCEDDEPTEIRLKVNIDDPGGIEAFNQLFPPGGIAVEFDVNIDGGSGTGNSYLAGKFRDTAATGDAAVPSVLQNKRFDGYCVDAGNSINTNVWYDAIAYSFYNIDWANTDSSSCPDCDNIIGNIDSPWNMPAVAYCVNHWKPGDSYSADGLSSGLSSPYTLSSGTLQRAIWGIVDDAGLNGGCGTGTGCALGANDLAWADYIRDDCIQKGLASRDGNSGRGSGGMAAEDFVPGCDDIMPIIVVPTTPTDSTIQNQYVQTTFQQLNIPCVSEEIEVTAVTHCTTGGIGSSGGDPHFKTFGGQWFDFHGACDLVLAHFPDFAAGLGLAVDVRTTSRYDYSYIETVAIKIGEDILEISSFGQYMLNSISQAEFPLTLADFAVSHTQPRQNLHFFTIDLGDEKSIVVKVYKDLVYVDIKVHDGDSTEVKNGYGMLGTWLGGTRLGRDGATVIDNDIEYGQEWQVRDTDAQLFTTTRAPQWPAKCEMPNPTERASRRLGENTVSMEEATTACAHVKSTHQHDMCVFDVIATADLSLAQGGAY